MWKEAAVGSLLGIIICLAFFRVDIFPLVILVLLAAGIYAMLKSQLGGQVGGFKGRKTNKAITFDDIGGQDTAVQELKEALEFLLKPQEIKKMGIRPLKGILLVGPPGTGKTLLARAAASYTSSAFVSASGSEFIEMYAGVGARRVRQLFQEARKKGGNEGKNSCIVFIDELDILGAKRGSNQSHLEYDQTLNQLLVEMDGLGGEESTRLLVIGATNRHDMLDPALTRPGRFDRQVGVGLPDKKGRIRIMQIHTRNKPLGDDVKIEELAQATFGMSGAQLESLTNEAAILALRDNKKKIEARYFNEAIDKVMLGEVLDHRPGNDEIRRVGIHEAGHAVVSELLHDGSVSSLTIVPRGQALGFMRKNSPEHDQYLYTASELKTQIMVALGGAVAEEICMGERSTGARNDFEQAWNLAKAIVNNGLSGLGVISLDEIPGEMVFNECNQLIKELEQNTLTILRENLMRLNRVAARLLEEETLERESFLQAFQAA